MLYTPYERLQTKVDVPLYSQGQGEPVGGAVEHLRDGHT